MDKESTLKSQLSKKEKLVEKLQKENKDLRIEIEVHYIKQLHAYIPELHEIQK